MLKEPKIRRQFTWDSFLELAGKDAGLDYQLSRKDTGAWAGCEHSEALAMASGAGYSDVLPEVERIVARVTDTVAADLFQTSFQSTWDVAGAEVDMGRFLAGEPECMIESTPVRISRQGRAVRIVVPVAVHSGISPDVIMRRGAAVMALADILARAQHPLEVWTGHGIHAKSKDRLLYMIEVQRANEPLDPGRLMYALAHPSMLRRLVVGLEEHESASVRRDFGVHSGGGYGAQPYGCQESDLEDSSGNAIVLPELGSDEQWTEDYAVTWIEQQLAEIFA